MASNSSGSLAPGASYNLGQYTFTLSNVVTEDERVLQAHCSGPEGNAAGGISVPTSAQLQSWSVEADETEATVYASLKENGGGNLPHPIPTASGGAHSTTSVEPKEREQAYPAGVQAFCKLVGETQTVYRISAAPFTFTETTTDTQTGSINTRSYNSRLIATVNNKPIHGFISSSGNVIGTSLPIVQGDPNNYDFYSVVYGDDVEETEKLVTRFPIDIREAGGDWGDTGDPMTTLHVVVTGALSGRHNDPTASAEGAEIYSYVPADNEKEAWYGCGGDGGYGGGGGTGASTIIVNDFATSRAGGKDIQANARRHGYGSGGGKGANGGDGCILIYYSTPVPPNP